jgi:HEAT repeat protein
MKAKDYRQEVEKDLGGADEAAAAADLVPAADAEPKDEQWPALIAQLANPSATSEERRTAIHALQAGAFLSAQFAACRPGFIEALRKAATDPDEALRHSALDALSNMKDPYARDQLVKGLENAAEALVPPAVALGLLARNDHDGATGLARRIIESDAGRHVKAQAVRLLARDPGCASLLEQLMKDKNGFEEVRRASAAALQSLHPEAFEGAARAILSDRHDFDDIQKSVRAALERSGALAPASEEPSSEEPSEPPSSNRPGAGTGLLSRLASAVRGLFGRGKAG